MSLPPPPAPAAPRRRLPRRAWLYPLLLLAGACWAGTLGRDPQDDLDTVVARLRVCDRSERWHPTSGAAVGILGARGWTLTLYVGDTPSFAPATFLCLIRVDAALRGELLTDDVARSRMSQQVLVGAELDAYLARGGLDLTSLDEVVSRRWGAPGVVGK